MRRITLLFLLLLLVAAAGAFGQTELKAAGLTAPVTVRRDARAIPYFEAANEADMYFAQGYVTAGDRLFQMDLTRRVARGETAELFGPLGLEEDKRWRRLGFAHICDESYRMLAPELKASLDNYARGVNAYIATLRPEDLPAEYKILQLAPREWLPTDSLVIGKILSDALSNTWQQDLIRVAINQLPEAKAALLTNKVTDRDVVLYGKDAPFAISSTAISSTTTAQPPKTVKDLPLEGGTVSLNPAIDEARRLQEIRRASLEKIGIYAEDNAASNNWVISGKRTADGRAMLANDPHLQATAPGIWYLINQSMPGLRVAGVTLPGVPGVILGHNADIAWGATNLGPDVQDLVIETAQPLRMEGAGGVYDFVRPNGGRERAKLRFENIKVRKSLLGPIGDFDTERLDVMESSNGVIVMEDPKDRAKKYALKWTARDPKNMELGAFYYLNRAKDWAGFNAALKKYGGATQNFVYADVKGNIGWHTAGAVPVRRSGDGSVPYDGATADGDWTGMIPYDEMPHLYNPPNGYIVTANQRVTGTANKYFSVLSRDAATPWRAARIREMIEAKPKLTMDDSGAIQWDVFNIPLREFAEQVRSKGGATAATLDAIGKWDGRMTADSKTALLVNEMRVVLADKLAAANFVDKNGARISVPAFYLRERVLRPALKNEDKTWLPAGYASYKDLLLDCEKQAELNLSALAARLKKDRAALVWGDNFTANFFNPLASVPLIGAAYKVQSTEVNGSGQTPNVGASVSMRHIASPGNWDATRFVIPLGQSGNARSPHWKDQFDAWRTGKTPVFPFSKPAVEKAAVEVTVMRPGN